MFFIEYKSDGEGCPQGGVFGKLKGYDWNSNDYSDTRFPAEGEVLDFYVDHKFLDADFFYFGSEFICSEKMLKIIKSFRYGRIDVVELSIKLKHSANSVASKRYFLIRSREIVSLLDCESSVYELRRDPLTNLPEVDHYHDGRKIYDLISKFSMKSYNPNLDFFICSELLMEEYVFSSSLKKALESSDLKGLDFVAVEETFYDARLEF